MKRREEAFERPLVDQRYTKWRLIVSLRYKGKIDRGHG